MIRQKGIFISILNQGTLRKENAHLVASFIQNDRYKINIDYPQEKPIEHNRNKIVQRFLGFKNFDYLLMIDDDVTPPYNILDLADFQLDIVTPVMFTRQKKEVVPLVTKRNKDGKYVTMNLKDLDGLVEADATGTGCMLIKREVLENPKMKYPFKNYYDADGIKTTGLDFNFCTRAKELGYKVYVHTDYVAGHIVDIDLKDIYEKDIHIKLLQEELIKLREKQK